MPGEYRNSYHATTATQANTNAAVVVLRSTASCSTAADSMAFCGLWVTFIAVITERPSPAIRLVVPKLRIAPCLA